MKWIAIFFLISQSVFAAVTSDQGRPTVNPNAWPVKVTDGTNTLGTVSNPLITSATGGGSATAANQVTGNASLSSIDGKITAVNTGAVVVSSSALPSGAATAAKQPALGTAGTPSSDVITVQGHASGTALKVDGSASTQPVSGSVTASLPTASSATHSNVVASASSTTILSSNGSRKGYSIYNDSAAILYVKEGATASTSSFKVAIPAGGYFESQAQAVNYTGVIDGIWASATGAARVVEY